ncbi:MAG: hypothetical protein GY883_18305 [Shimia sp.]|nr:hypothetical protein [Shimia sp.]
MRKLLLMAKRINGSMIKGAQQMHVFIQDRSSVSSEQYNGMYILIFLNVTMARGEVACRQKCLRRNRVFLHDLNQVLGSQFVLRTSLGIGLEFIGSLESCERKASSFARAAIVPEGTL